MGFAKGLFKLVLFLILLAGVAYGAYYYGQMSVSENILEVDVPINQTFSFDIDQEVVIPIKTKITFPINESFKIEELVPINTFVELDEVVIVPLNVSGQITNLEIPIKKKIPINTSVKISKVFYLQKDVLVDVDKEFLIPIQREVRVPVEGVFETNVPVPEWMQDN